MKLIATIFLLLSSLACADTELSNAQIAQEIVHESVAKYKGLCPCPYSIHPDGRQCGYRSAFSSRASSAPICYSIAVTPKMIDDYKKRHKP